MKIYKIERAALSFLQVWWRLLQVSLTSAQAQTATIITNEGFNLLSLSPSDNASKGNALGASETTIEDAFNVVTDNGTTGSAIDLSTQQAVPSATLPARNVQAQRAVTVWGMPQRLREQTAVRTEQSAVIESTVTIGLRRSKMLGLPRLVYGNQQIAPEI